ncbi:hypothetical protein [Filimonas effusa]|uniref:Bacterial Pleckstrin homology domain-containing protein n=1 Tax=Filimonas effusa TaxID=2508721 RepID=A0A4Q1DAD2_9BACT|nr:hypothetical protein [Filimonas effusa]RXK85725.1 hypothetical protein ESB13_02600 [Filimonas effusa]
MPNSNLFSEKQQFRQKWIYIILAIILLALVAQGVYAYLYEVQLYTALAIPIVVVYIVVVLLIRMILHVTITDETIHFRFTPFRRKDKVIRKERVKSISVVQYNAMEDYGGWGIRIGHKGKAYTASGRYGISIEFEGKKHLLLGTGKPKEVAAFLEAHWHEKYWPSEALTDEDQA